MKKKKQKKEIIDSNFSQITPAGDYDVEHNCYIKRNGEYFDFIRILPINVSVDPFSEVVLDNMETFDSFLRTYKYSFNEIVLNFPTDVHTQIEYYKKKIKECDNPKRKELLIADMQRLESIGDNDSEKNYIYMFYGKDYNELKKKIDLFISFYPRNKIQFLDREEKDIIISKMVDITSVLSDY